MSYKNISLTGRTAIVTGAGGGTGRDMAIALGLAGANVVIAARRASTAEETARMIRELGGSVLPVEADVTCRADMVRTVAATVEAFNGLDIMIHNAVHGATGMPQSLIDITDEDWDAQSAVSLNGAFICAQSAFSELKRAGDRGRFLLMGSAFGQHGAGHNPIYSASKAAYRGFTRALAREWGGYGITVNMIAPSSLTEVAKSYLNSNPELRDQYLTGFALGRMGRPRDDIGGAVVAMCSEAFGYVTGQTLMVDGGLYTVM
ncbi:SDR family NAD(P)-dependent oxidoreductase [Pseudomonas sp. BF-R-19]|uniref:SDR family NAD(P)-dependent oxidoreductase n=1 Tax=Pseudomonas sp. BF-R-19 TaxID=2832397 RepID=UPI001CBD01FB|nr:SDR family NAD(P)-dependent oxidoreductase [Pseudomonas sp. BF-R-19]